MQNSDYQPVTDAKELKGKNAVYLPGLPLTYLFNAKLGYFTVKGREDSPRFQKLTIKPVGFMAFKTPADRPLFGKDTWVEFFFANERGAICSVMLHGYSAKRLKQFYAQVLHYEEIDILDTVISIVPEQLSNEHGTFYIAQFQYKGESKFREWQKWLPADIYNLDSADYLDGPNCIANNISLPQGGEEVKGLPF